MSDKGRTFRSERSIRQMHLIEKALKALTVATIAELADEVCIAKCTVGDYLRHMAATGRAHCVVPATMVNGAGIPGAWAIGQASLDTTDHDESETDTAPRKVIVRKEWATTKVHDPYALPAEFFAKAA